MHPLEDTRAPNPTHVGQACPRCQVCGCLHLSPGGANPEVVGIPPAEVRMKARLCPARINTPPSAPCRFIHPASSHTGPGLPVQEGLALGRKSPYPPIPNPHLLRIQGIPQNHKVLPTGRGIPCPDTGSNRSQMFFSPQLACPGVCNFTVCLLVPISDSWGTKFSWEWGVWLLSDTSLVKEKGSVSQRGPPHTHTVCSNW